MPIAPEVGAAVARALGAPLEFRALAGGTNRRTFLAESGGTRWVVRSDSMPAHSLQRAVAAQARAEPAGVRVPRTVAHGLAEAAGGPLFWCAETWHAGEPFDHTRAGLPEARGAIRDLAQQLRHLHAVEIDAYGDLPPRPYEVYASCAEWVANKRRRVAPAVWLVGGGAALARDVERAYDQIAGLYAGTPRLCKGDCAGGNLLVAGGRVTIVDWEWAQGLDPAADLAYWCRATPDPSARALLLAAYKPDTHPLFNGASRRTRSSTRSRRSTCSTSTAMRSRASGPRACAPSDRRWSWRWPAGLSSAGDHKPPRRQGRQDPKKLGTLGVLAVCHKNLL